MTLELAEGSGNTELLAHLLECIECRDCIARREKYSSQEERDALVRDVLDRVKQKKLRKDMP